MAISTKILLSLVLFCLLGILHCEGKATITSGLESQLRQRKFLNILVTMKENPSTFLRGLMTVNSIERSSRINTMVKQLQTRAESSQQNLLNMIKLQRSSFPISYESLWVSNQVILRGVTPQTFKQIQAMEEVLEINEEEFFTIQPLIESKPDLGRADMSQWGIGSVEAPKAWSRGINGSGIIVGVIDTGARGTHESLRSNYVGKQNYGWYDPVNRQAEPYDDNGHGTHTTGTIVGTSGIGVAPGAKWMACKGCASESCSSLHLATCMQFMACPTNSSGGSPNCSKAPHLVSNSWGGSVGGERFYYRFIETLRAIGIVVLFAAGNSGPFCSTVGSPGDYDNVITVGAINSNNQVAYFSSAGPTYDRKIKPDIVAPGQGIRSAGHGADSEYIFMSGTSMACPHAAGVVALLLSKNSNLSPDQVRMILNNSTEPVSAFGINCGLVRESMYPNNHGGHGRINATKVLENNR